MAQITVEREHALGREAAREKAEHLVQKLAEKYSLKPKWTGDVVEFEGKGAKGKIEVEDTLIRVSIELNFFLSAMSGVIKTEVEKVLDKELLA